jgi:hypothetical protein
MVYSSSRKLTLSGWLKKNGNTEYNSPLKLQKFLLFYEAITKINGGTADFSNLKGYKRGPVFSNVWGDYTYERLAFDDAVEKEYSAYPEQVVEEYAKRSQFLISILSENELSTLTHKLNIWKSKEDRIMKGERQVELQESDFTDEDAKLMALLEKMYPISLIDSSHVIEIDSHYFVLSKQDSCRLSAQHFDILSELADNEQLANPVYVELDEEGRLIVD